MVIILYKFYSNFVWNIGNSNVFFIGYGRIKNKVIFKMCGVGGLLLFYCCELFLFFCMICCN